MDFLGMGPLEILVIGLVAFIFLGPTRMAVVARNLGKVVRDVRRATSDIPSLLALDEEVEEPRRRTEEEPTQSKAPLNAPDDTEDTPEHGR